MASYDPAYANSSGYFKDPGTGEELSVDMPRSVECELRDGKFIWPQVEVSTGESVKIVYKYFTDEEKQLYKEYRGRGSSEPRAPRQPRAPKNKGTPHLDPATGEVVYDEPEETVTSKRVEPTMPDTNKEVEFIGTEDCAASANTKELIASCTRLIGVSRIAGLSYALLTKDEGNKIYHVPHALLSEEDIRRLS